MYIKLLNKEVNLLKESPLYKGLKFVEIILEGESDSVISDVKGIIQNKFSGILKESCFRRPTLTKAHHLYNYLFEHNLLSKYSQLAENCGYPTTKQDLDEDADHFDFGESELDYSADDTTQLEFNEVAETRWSAAKKRIKNLTDKNAVERFVQKIKTNGLPPAVIKSISNTELIYEVEDPNYGKVTCLLEYTEDGQFQYFKCVDNSTDLTFIKTADDYKNETGTKIQ